MCIAIRCRIVWWRHQSSPRLQLLPQSVRIASIGSSASSYSTQMPWCMADQWMWSWLYVLGSRGRATLWTHRRDDHIHPVDLRWRLYLRCRSETTRWRGNVCVLRRCVLPVRTNTPRSRRDQVTRLYRESVTADGITPTRKWRHHSARSLYTAFRSSDRTWRSATP